VSGGPCGGGSRSGHPVGNLAAEDDLVAAHLDLKPYFPPAPRSTVTPHTHIVDTGSKPHDITHYLTKPTAGRIITETLAGL
jgi:hypothetical protein